MDHAGHGDAERGSGASVLLPDREIQQRVRIIRVYGRVMAEHSGHRRSLFWVIDGCHRLNYDWASLPPIITPRSSHDPLTDHRPFRDITERRSDVP
jgi:hypothetical protein